VTINLGSVGFNESQIGPILVFGIPLIAIILFFTITKTKTKKPKTNTK
jgi:hypothetical protein